MPTRGILGGQAIDEVGRFLVQRHNERPKRENKRNRLSLSSFVTEL